MLRAAQLCHYVTTYPLSSIFPIVHVWKLLVNQYFGTKICGQGLYFQQMLSNINTLWAHSSICLFCTALDLSLTVTEQDTRSLKISNHTVVQSKFWCPCSLSIWWFWCVIYYTAGRNVVILQVVKSLFVFLFFLFKYCTDISSLFILCFWVLSADDINVMNEM